MPPPLMQEGAGSESSSISSPPQSPPQNVGDEITVARRFPPTSALGEGVVNSASAHPAQPALSHNATAHNTNGALSNADSTAKPKRQRKAPAKTLDGNDKPVKEKKPRKPREPKVKKEGETTAAPRKRQKTEDKSTPAPVTAADAPAGPRQSTLTEMVSHFQPPGPPASAPPPSQHHQPTLPSQQQYPPPPPRSQQPTPSDSMPRSSLPPHTQPHTSNPPTPRPFSSGQNYDPIRGSTIDSAPPRTSVAANGAHSAQASPHINRASASPSITSLIDPHPATTTSAPVVPYSSQTATMHSQQHQPPPPFVPSQQQSPTPPRAAPVQVAAPTPPAQPTAVVKPIGTAMDGAMDIDSPACGPLSKPDIKIQSKSSSSAPTPKPGPVKANSPPKATGSGLLSSSDLFGGPSSNQGTDRKGIDIEIRISLNPNGGNQVNIAQEIAKKYGRDAINPRAAAHREALLRVAAAANKIDGGSADDMSVDLMSEMDGDSNVEMGGVDEEKSNTGADDKPVRKRRKKVEEYDKEDDFIDDTELAWQEKAAVAKDGFFVYSGPLVPEGSAAQVESNAPTRGGRGGRRGRGRAAAAAGTTHAQLAEKNKDPNAPTGRGRGRGRGTGAPRKPRITKADRERMEAEKAERERAAGGGTMGPASTPAMGSTPTLVVSQQPHNHSNGHSATQLGPGVSV
ncbi:hypothetical protein M409DRAFT_19379 [Zasmidium cellare ATCC 36951]|uniref:Hpc2-related domain-containing protein n=1 Tax=Zasmidium cellare ATCC 36951 TaxID=1080233 RepID=A0A6A6CWI7_ZASCE|nr:uncharacterized protein M409DRAFT_19379 [Zasmidium cellare ATCC 36951]KAF2170560.1 hypothetical protein M409DRAFT_19379 [Zasmidium cellare ATCC 36951]